MIIVPVEMPVTAAGVVCLFGAVLVCALLQGGEVRWAAVAFGATIILGLVAGALANALGGTL